MRNSQAGMSLIEIMTVLIIIGLIAGLVVTNVMGKLEQAKIQTTKIVIDQIRGSLDEFNRDCNRYPTADEGLRALTQKPGDCRNYPPGGYLKDGKIPKDGWGADFIYNIPPVVARNGRFEVLSYGKDKAEGGADADEDINSNTMEVN